MEMSYLQTNGQDANDASLIIAGHLESAIHQLNDVCSVAQQWATQPFLERFRRSYGILLALKHSLSGTFYQGAMSELYGTCCYHLSIYSVGLTV
jgi:hypothetical protein